MVNWDYKGGKTKGRRQLTVLFSLFVFLYVWGVSPLIHTKNTLLPRTNSNHYRTGARISSLVFESSSVSSFHISSERLSQRKGPFQRPSIFRAGERTVRGPSDLERLCGGSPCLVDLGDEGVGLKDESSWDSFTKEPKSSKQISLSIFGAKYIKTVKSPFPTLKIPSFRWLYNTPKEEMPSWQCYSP